jgi:uncharacterized membrane-anchored protein
MRKLIVVLAAVLLLGLVNFTIYQREQLRREGRVVLLELVPVDPRSLMQGDYMALNFAVANAAFPSRHSDKSEDGQIVVALDGRGVASFRRFADSTPLAANEAVLVYRIRNNMVKFATNAFFFQEGHAEDYQGARYGEFRVSPDGEMILTNLRAADLTLLGNKP